MAKNPQIQQRINEIANELANGVERGTILEKYGKKWNIKKTAIDNYIKDAKPIAKELQIAIKKELTDNTITEINNEFKGTYLSKLERQDILSKIIIGHELDEVKKPIFNQISKKFEIITVHEKPDAGIKIKAIAELNKMDGDYAPTKTELTGKGGKDLMPDKFKITIRKKK